MSVRDHLALVANWARGQLRQGVEAPELGIRLRQLVDAAESLRDDLTYEPEAVGENVIPLAHFRRRAS